MGRWGWGGGGEEGNRRVEDGLGWAGLGAQGKPCEGLKDESEARGQPGARELPTGGEARARTQRIWG